MRAILQRVGEASVTVEVKTIGAIGRGLLILLGVHQDDTSADAEFLVKKCAELRIFPDDEGKMNRSLLDVGGDALVVSQFTLYGDTRKGRRPSFIEAAPPEKGRELYEYFVAKMREIVPKVDTGSFGAMMQVDLVNDGPVTLIVESR